jgi:hypothetical protein
MRNVQRSTRAGGAWPTFDAKKVRAGNTRASIGSKTSVGFATTAANSRPAPLFVSGWEGSEARLDEVAQHVLFAQQFGRQLCTLAVDADTHDGAGTRRVAAPKALATSTDSISLPTIFSSS